MSREMKHSGIEWIGEIPKEWNLVPTKRLFSCKKQVAGNCADDYERLALTMQGVIKREKDDNEGLQPEKFDGYQILQRNEIVFKLIDLANVKTSRVGLSPYLGIVSPAYIIIRNNSEDNRFFYYWFMFMYHHNIFNQMGDDGVRSSLNADDVLNIPIANIPLSEQQKIANYLDKVCGEVDEMIALQEQMIEELKAYKQSVITEAVTKGLNPDAPIKDSGIEWIGEIPEGWEIARIKNILEDSSLQTTTGQEEQLSVTQNKGIIKSSEIQVANPSTSQIGWKIVKKDDIVFNKYKAHSGVFFVSPYDGIVTFNYSVYHCREGVLPKFYELLFKTPLCIAEFRKAMKGVGESISPLYTRDLFRIDIFIPPLSEQQSIASYLDEKCSEIDSLIAIKQAKIEELKEYKKSLIYEYVTGKKEIA